MMRDPRGVTIGVKLPYPYSTVEGTASRPNLRDTPYYEGTSTVRYGERYLTSVRDVTSSSTAPKVPHQVPVGTVPPGD